MIRDIWTLLKQKKKKKERNQREKETTERLVKDLIIRVIRTLLEQQEEDHDKPKIISNVWNNNYTE